MTSSTLTSRTVTRIAFGVIIAFVLAQVVWWIVFQQRYIENVTREQLAAYQRDAATANLALELAAGADPAAAEAVRLELAARYPDLRFEPDADSVAGGRFVIDEATAEAFVRRQRGFVRMFAFEGSFFVLVVLAGLVVLALNLRAERELKRRQQNFLSAITHEFKTPLSTLRLLIETALYRPLTPEKQREYLRRMDSELARLEQTSEQVLASARLEQAQSAPVLQAVDLGAVTQEIVTRLQQGLEARGAQLTVERPRQPLPVSLDPDAFSVVLGNLLDNAVKYSPGARKSVTVRLEASGDLVLLHVEDEGVGVAGGEAKRIFERFYRSGEELTRSAPGVGLGLHLVKSVTEAMNGWVRVEPNDRAGRGSRFTVVLPRRVAAAEAAAAPPETPTGGMEQA